MKIAFVSTILDYPWGGADAPWTFAAEAAVERGDEVMMAVSEAVAGNPRVRALVGRGASLLIRPAPPGPQPIWRRAWRRRPWARGPAGRLSAVIRRFAPDLLVFSCGGTYDPIREPQLVDWLRSSGTPYRIIANFQNEHPALDEADRLRAADVFKAADRILCVSPRNLEVTRLHLLSDLPNAESIHFCMLHSPPPPGSEVPWAEPQPWSLACVARLEPVKGIDLLLPALAAALGGTPGWRLNVFGKGPQRDYLEACARRCGIGDRVSFRGYVPNLDDIWGQNHLMVSPAVDEGVPMTIPEAMLWGRAVLATRVGGAAEWIEHGRTGFVCPAPTAALLAESLREAWGQRERWRQMGRDAAVRARSLYRPRDFMRIISQERRP